MIDTSNILYPRPTVHNTRGHQLRVLPPIASYHQSQLLSQLIFSLNNQTMEQSSRICNQCNKFRTFQICNL